MSYSRLVQSHHEDGHQVTRTGNLWQSGGESEQSKNEEIEYAESVEGGATCASHTEAKEVKEAAPPETPTQKPDVEVAIDAIQRKDTTSGKGKPKSGDNVATRPPEGRSEGKGGKSRHVWRNLSSFALHASEEMFTAISPIKCESLVNTHGNDDYADDYADVYN